MVDSNKFQLDASRVLSNLAQRMNMSGYKLDSGNGVEQKNFLNKTIFTIYTDRLDKENSGKIEIAIGIDNVAEERETSPLSVDEWCQTNLFRLFRPASRKSPEYWPRLALHEMKEVERFFKKMEELYQFVSEEDLHSTVASTATPSKQSLPIVDEHLMREILTRRGQGAFRNSLLLAYDGHCTISGCTDIDVLEAAHITRHSETQDYKVANGLLLRADLHTLFDLFLISINPASGIVVVASKLSSEYQIYCGNTVSLPSDPLHYPDPTGLMRHYQAWQSKNQVSQ